MAEARTDREQQTHTHSDRGAVQSQRQLQQGQRGLRRRSGIDYGANPFEFVRQLTEQMFGPILPSAFRGGAGRLLEETWSPQIEVFERDGKLVVRADLPGMTPDDVRIEARDNALIIEGERQEERREERGDMLVTERSYGSFYRIIPLPEGVNPEGARAKFDNGVLEIEMDAPKKQTNSRTISIEKGSGEDAASGRQASSGQQASSSSGQQASSGQQSGQQSGGQQSESQPSGSSKSGRKE
jgi:HSP20 family protein